MIARADGEKLVFVASAQMGPKDERGIAMLYHFGERSAKGWAVRPALSMTSDDAVTDALSSAQANARPSQDLSTLGFSTNGVTLGPPNPVRGISQYISSGVGSERWISAPDPGMTPTTSPGAVLGGTPDFSTVYFLSAARLTQQDQTRSGDGLYQYREGVVRPAGVLPDGTVPTSGVLPAGYSTRSDIGNQLAQRNAVSRDGRRLFFTAAVGGVRQLYVREDGARTRLLSHALGAPTTPAAGGIVDPFDEPDLGVGRLAHGYAVATPDGSRVFFASNDALAAGAAAAPAGETNYYRADAATGTLTYLPGLRGPIVAIDDAGAQVLWMDVDGSSARRLMLSTFDGSGQGTSHMVAPSRPTVPQEIPWVGTTADGAVWTLGSRIPLDPAFPDTNGTGQVYRFTVDGGIPSTPRCLSCLAAVTYTSHANLTSFSAGTTENGDGESTKPVINHTVTQRSMSADGRRVFFDTRTALVPEDQNGLRDVYMWEAGRGVVLLSDGRTPKPSWFHDASESGDDVFIVTAAGLDQADRNQSYDVYDVRVGGGYATTPEPSCAGDGCQPPVEPRRPASTPRSDRPAEVVSGPSDLQPAPARVAVRRVRRDRTGATIRISTSAAGTVRVSGSRTVAMRRSAATRRSYTVKLRLRRPVRKLLARHGKVAVRVRVRFAPRSGKAVSATVKTTIKRAR
ncbi:hypothetical protein BDZ31_000365 [Conexibacter arvalis]|uniref:WD40-like Beta Propeller Repeat n=1 Tax=Conexibacter arvalis TaxID=912552 RepID=A0A840I8E2_9ACTN|nr:hypothetical protein [Conexibacter arvalis]